MASITPTPDKISVIIPHLNQPTALKRCLASLFEGSTKPDEVIVVDNGSIDLPVDVCGAHPTVTLLSQPLRGPGPARNLGVERAHGNILAFIDADCVACPTWLEIAAGRIAAYPTRILGGDVRILPVVPRSLTAVEAYESIFAFRMDHYIARHGFTGTGNMVVHRSVFDKIGGFKGVSVAEDREWGQRATRAGHVTMFVPELRVYHPARTSFGSLAEKWDRQLAHDHQRCVAGRDQFFWIAKAAALLASPVVAIPLILSSDRIAGRRHRCLAFVTLVRIRWHRAQRMIQLARGMDDGPILAGWNGPDDR